MNRHHRRHHASRHGPPATCQGFVHRTLNGLSRKFNREEAQVIAASIMRYRAQYPGRPIYLVGHSGGATLAVFALEALPPDQRVNTAVLLGCALERRYNLSAAMQRTEAGIHNYYSPLDIYVSQVYVGTVAALAGRPKITAAAYGFEVPPDIDASHRRDYESRLVQHKYEFGMLGNAHWGGHFGWTMSPFVRKQIAPVLAQSRTPQPTPTYALAKRVEPNIAVANSVVPARATQPVTFMATDQHAVRR